VGSYEVDSMQGKTLEKRWIPCRGIIKRKGERGSPYLIPMEGVKVLKITLFTRMEKKTKEVRIMTQ
jgi:hypothetical protein